MARMLHTLGFFAVGLSLSSPALAATARTSLAVSATVQPSCLVSSAPGQGPAGVTCSHLGGGSVAIGRSNAAMAPPGRQTAPSPTTRTEPRSDGVTYLTITY
jgi:hypothetical protein